MSNIPPTRSSSPGALRMRRYRKRRRQRMQYIPIPLHVSEIDALIRMRLLKDEQREDVEALQTAVLTLVYRALENGVTCNGGGSARRDT